VAELFPPEGIIGDSVKENGEFCVVECALLPQIVPGTRDCACRYQAGGGYGEN
jgi:hypothetical protein